MMQGNNPVISFIALGSNLQQPSKQISKALLQLADLPKTKLVVCSKLHKTKPVGFLAQPDFINAVAKILTRLTAIELLQQLLAIEQQFGRVRNKKNGPRILDLDLLLYGEETIDSDQLIVPHPRMQQRAFVLDPLYEIAPELAMFQQPWGFNFQQQRRNNDEICDTN